MSKRKTTITAGPLVKVCIYTPPIPNGPDHVRAARARATTAAQKALNCKTAQGRLEALIAANFASTDLFITLTYSPKHLPNNRKAAKLCFRSFIKQLRAARARAGADLKYIYCTEDKHGSGRIHHHMIINASGKQDNEIIRSLWSRGQIIDVEQVAAGKTKGRSFLDLARYMTKENGEARPNGAQLWSGSRNLTQPRRVSEWVPDNETVVLPENAEQIERQESITEWGSYLYIKYVIHPERAQRPRCKRRRTPRRNP